MLCLNMEHNKSIESVEKTKTDNELIDSKVFNTQSIIRNKYKKARMDRLELENETARTKNPIIANSIAIASASKQINFSIPIQLKQSNVNELCMRLRLLLSSSFANSDNHTQEMNSILNELHVLDIIV